MLVLLHLFGLLLLVVLGFYVFVADPRRRANQTFAAFIAFLALWTTKDLVFWNFETNNLFAGVWAASSFVIALLMQCSLIVFAWVFPENSRTPRRKAAILFSPSIFLIPAVFFGLLWRDVGFRGDSFFIELKPIAYAYVAYIYFLYVYGTWILFKKYLQLRGSQSGQQIAAILIATAVTAVLKTVANIALPFFGVYDLLPYNAIFLLPGVVIFAFAISNFKLFSLQTALDQFRLFPITYKTAISIASVAIASFVIFQIPIVWWAFRDGVTFDGWKRYLVFSVISALVPNLLLLLLVVRSISRPLQRITLAAVEVTNGRYGTEVDLRRSNDEIGLLANSFNEMSRKMALDIEQLKTLNDQLARAERLAAMGTLAAGVAHEVNNPLASISSLVQMMKASASDDDRQRLDLISNQIQRITRVTKDLTDFSRVRPAARSMVEMNSVVEAAIRMASFDAAFQQLELIREYADGLPNALADADQLQQVFLNLLFNARDAMEDGGRLIVTTAQDPTGLLVSIEDSGTGIDESGRKQLFDPFFTTKPAGTG
ncbi:MAG: histidine kinase dimerization/phospho-acceptor domain-containing protein, partial [bacterium]|nr:histidine kinase dimerization/phospho-acceptor domain-containing protein [bacterium]